MQYLIDDYLNYVQELQGTLDKQQSYFQKFSYQPETALEIEREEREIAEIISREREKIKIKREMEEIRGAGIAGHPEYRSVRMRERQEGREGGEKWRQYVRVNHEVELRVHIEEIVPVFHCRDPQGQGIAFEALKFHLHHADQQDSTRTVRYHPKHGLYFERDLVDGKIMRSERKIQMKIKHCIRSHNIHLYSQLFEQRPIKIIAEASYGLVLGIANLHIDDLSCQDQPILHHFRCVSFKAYSHEQGEEGHAERTAFIGKVRISIQSNPIAPEMQELKVNAQKELKKRQTSKSKSPNRLISTPARSVSPKRKRQLLTGLTSNTLQAIPLTVYEGVEYRYKLLSMGSKREITYRQLKNIRQRRIELVKIEEQFYLKCLLVRENSNEKGQISFQLNDQSFVVHVIPDRLYRVIDFHSFSKGKDKEKANKLVCIGQSALVYPHDSNRIIKNMIKQTSVDGLPSSIFIKTVFSECEITTQWPFVITEIVHKEDGYMLQYYYDEGVSLQEERQVSLLFFLESRYKGINEIHVFDCAVQPRTVQRDTLLVELRVSPQTEFYSIPMGSITSENYEYTIRSTSPSLSVINSPYRPSPFSPSLLLQLLPPLPPSLDLVFTDSKARTFFLRLCLLPS